MSDERTVEQTVLSVSLGPIGKPWTVLPPAQHMHGGSSEVVRSFRDAMEYAKFPLLQEAASLAISILATSHISSIEGHESIAQQACLMTHIILTEPSVNHNIKDTVEILRKAEFLVKQQTSSRWINRGFQLQDDVETKTLESDISDMLKVLHRGVSATSEASEETSSDTDITGSNHTTPTPTGLQCLPLPDPPKNLEIKKTLLSVKRFILKFLLGAYLIVLLDLPVFYASRLSTWAQSIDPLPRTCPNRNITNSIIWMIFDEQPECDIQFCDRVLTTLLREWKTLRVLSSIVFASVFAMLQISRVESDAIVSIPAYFSLISGIMAAISATILDLYFQSGKSSPSILSWVNSLRNISEPKCFHDDTVVLALPAISTAWCTILFIVSIVAFTFQAYTGIIDGTDPDPGHQIISTGTSLAFRITLLIVILIGFSFLLMILATLRKISHRPKEPGRGRTAQELSHR